MDSDAAVQNQISRLRKRVRLLLAERYGLIGTACGMVCACVFVYLSSHHDALLDYYLWAGIAAAGGVIGLLAALVRRLDDFTVAFAADRRSGTRERLSTSVALRTHEDLQDIERAQIADASDCASHLDSRQVFPHRFGLPHGVFAAAALLLAAFILVPVLPWFQSETRKREVAAMKEQGARVTAVAKNIKKQADPEDEELRKLAAKLEKLGKHMESGRMDKKRAMLNARKLSKGIREQQDKLSKANDAKSMAKAASEMKAAGEQIARKMAQAIADQKKIPVDKALEQVPSDPKLAELASQTGPLSESQIKALENQIGKYADPKNLMPIPKELAEALAKLAENGDYQKAAELMRQLALKLKSDTLNQMDKEALEEQLEKLAEALKNTDLDKLAKAMLEQAEKLAKMSPEELEKLIKELEEAAKMAKLLEEAGGT